MAIFNSSFFCLIEVNLFPVPTRKKMMIFEHNFQKFHQNTVWRHMDIAIPENQGVMCLTLSIDSYDENLAQNWPLVFSKIFQEKQMKGSNFFEKNQLFSVAIFYHSLTKSRGKSKA